MKYDERVRRFRIISISLTIGLIVVFLSLLLTKALGNPFHDVSTTQTIKTMDNIKEKDKIIVIFHQTGCVDCKQIQNQVDDSIKKIKDNSKTEFVSLDYRDPKLKKYFGRYYVTKTPTIIVFEHGIATERYSGIDNQKVKEILEEN